MQQGSEEWLEWRKAHAVTCSEYASALGIGYVSRAKCMRLKLGIDEAPAPNWRMEEGSKREPWVVELYERIMNYFGYDLELKVDACSEDPREPRLGGSVDRLVRDRTTGEMWILECKTCPGGELRERIPPAHLLQMLGLCQIFGVPKAHYICSTYGQGILLAEVTYHPALWDEIVLPRLQVFCDWWEQKKIPPPVKKEDKLRLIEMIEGLSFIEAIGTRTRPPGLPQMLQDK